MKPLREQKRRIKKGICADIQRQVIKDFPDGPGGQDFVFQTQGAQDQSLIRELDSICHN